MPRFDKILFGVLLGCAFPVFFGLIAVTAWFYLDKNENYAPAYLAVGLMTGFIIDAIFLKGWINHRYELPIWLIIGMYLLYNIGMYGMFMGFPVFNLFWGLVAGYYFGRRIHYLKIPWTEHPGIINWVSIFSTFIMTLICISSGWIAMAGDGVGKDLQGMFGLHFEVTKPMVLAVVLIGGIFLIVSQYFLTKMTLKETVIATN